MIGILIATHGALATTLIECAGLILGKTNNIGSLGLFHGDSIDHFKESMRENIKRLDEGSGVLVLTDLCGGSPCNSSVFLLNELSSSEHKVESVVGVNIPILLEALEMRDAMSVNELASHLVELGKESIANVRKLYNL